MSNQTLSSRLNVGVAQIVVPGTSSGLVSASGLTGNTTGSAITTGFVGETQKQTGTVTATASYVQWGSITLGPGGVYNLAGVATAQGGAAVGTYIELVIGTTTASSSGTTVGYDHVLGAVNASQGTGCATIPCKQVVVPNGSTVTYYLNGRSDHTTTNDMAFSITSTRIA